MARFNSARFWLWALIRMGTTKAAAGGMENFVKIDREYVLASAAAARVPGVKQRLLYVSVSFLSTSSLIPFPPTARIFVTDPMSPTTIIGIRSGPEFKATIRPVRIWITCLACPCLPISNSSL